jgi:uncharacterized delta-60 repeat protein
MKSYKKTMLSEVTQGNFPKGDSLVHTVPATDTKKYIDTISIELFNGGDSTSDVQVLYGFTGNFDPNANSGVYSIVQQSDGKILLGGFFTSVSGTTRNGIARVFENGALDTAFDPNASSGVESIFQQSDGKILLGGGFTSVSATTRNRIARVFENGALDTTFNPNANGGVVSIVQQSDGKILLGGFFTSVQATTRNRIARVFENGALDTTFNPNANSTVRSIVQQSDGKILLGGGFTSVSGTARNYIARVFENGALDTTFNPNAGPSFSFVRSIVQQSDGKILLGGEFTSVSGTARNYIARVFENGALDTTFNPNAGPSFSFVRSIVQQSDGKILLGGEFTSVSGTARNYIARVFENGALDTTFNPNAGPSFSFVRSIVQQSDGKILLGGTFTSIDGTTRNRIARVFENGALDTTFDPNASSTVVSIVQQSDGKILLGGDFTSVSATTRNRIARVDLSGSLKGGISFDTESYHMLDSRELKNIKVSIHSDTDPQGIYVAGPSTVYILGHVDRIEEIL